MKEYFENHFSDIFRKEEIILKRASGDVYNSLKRFTVELRHRDKKKSYNKCGVMIIVHFKYFEESSITVVPSTSTVIST